MIDSAWDSQFRDEWDRLKKHFGNQLSMARYLGRSKQSISNYRRARSIPLRLALKLQEAGLGRIDLLCRDYRAAAHDRSC